MTALQPLLTLLQYQFALGPVLRFDLLNLYFPYAIAGLPYLDLVNVIPETYE